MVGYWVVDDVGTVINPMLVKGQIMGGIAQGMGQVLMEDKSYDEAGQVLAGSFMDYAMPRADNFCAVVIEDNPVSTPTNPLGVKGAGEAGTVGSLSAGVNAISMHCRCLVSGTSTRRARRTGCGRRLQTSVRASPSRALLRFAHLAGAIRWTVALN